MSSPRGMKGIRGGIPGEGRWICMLAYYPLEHLTNTSRMIRILKRMIYRRNASERTTYASLLLPTIRGNFADKLYVSLEAIYWNLCTVGLPSVNRRFGARHRHVSCVHCPLSAVAANCQLATHAAHWAILPGNVTDIPNTVPAKYEIFPTLMPRALLICCT